MAPQAAIGESPEYKALATRHPHLSKSIRLRKELEKLQTEMRSAKDRSTRLEIRSHMNNLAMELKRQDILKRLYGESKHENNYRRRFVIVELSQRLASALQRARLAYLQLQEKLKERSRAARLSRVSKLPPSLFDLRSLDTADRASALREWIEKRSIRTRRKESHRSISASAKKEV